MADLDPLLLISIVCLIVIFLFMFFKPIKFLFKILINSALGILGLIGFNYMLAPMGISVGINFLTIGICGILGIPGFVCLYLLKLIL